MNLAIGNQSSSFRQAPPMTVCSAFENPAIAFTPQSHSESERVYTFVRSSSFNVHGLQPVWDALREAAHLLTVKASPGIAFTNPALQETSLTEKDEAQPQPSAPRKGETGKLFERHLRHSHQMRATQAVNWYEHAQVYFTSGQFTKALECVEQALLFDVQNGLAWQLSGAALLELERYEDAVQAFHHAATLLPHEVEAWLGCGRAQLQLGLFEAALQSFNHALTLAPENASAWLCQARAYLQMQQLPQACDALAQAVTLKPADTNAWRIYGETLARNNQLPKALECYETVTHLEPANADNWVRLGSLLREMGRTSESLISFNIALDLAPQDFFIWYSRGLALADLARHTEAAHSFQRALDFNRTDPAVQYHLALSYLPRFLEVLAQGHVFNAKELWQEAVKLGRQARTGDWFVQELHYLQTAAALGHQRLVKVLITRLTDNELLLPLQYALDWFLTGTPPAGSLDATMQRQVEALKQQLTPPAARSRAAIA